jgi:ABC-2 type transport system permease protein
LTHLVLALGGALWLLAAAGAAAGVVYGRLPRLLGAASAQAPAASVVVAIAFAGFALVPRWSGLSWTVLVGFVLLGEIGPALRLDGWLMGISPYGHTPRLPGAGVDPLPLASMTAIAVTLFAAGMSGLRRRDLR